MCLFPSTIIYMWYYIHCKILQISSELNIKLDLKRSAEIIFNFHMPDISIIS